MSATCGPPSQTPLAYFDPDECCWKTSQGTFPWDSTPSSLTLPRWGMTHAGALYELPTPALHTVEPGFSLLLSTPDTAPEAPNMGSNRRSHPSGLGNQVQALLPTPVADHSRGLPQPGTDFQSLPNVVVSLLPTPGVAGGGKKIPEDAEWSGKAAYKPDGTKVQVHLDQIARLLPTPTVGDAASARNSTATRHRLPPTGIHAGNTLTDLLVPLHGEATSLLSADGSSSSDGLLLDPPCEDVAESA